MCTRRIEFLSDTNSSHFKYCKCLRLRNYSKQLHNEELLNGTVLYDKFTNFLNNTKKQERKKEIKKNEIETMKEKMPCRKKTENGKIYK